MKRRLFVNWLTGTGMGISSAAAWSTTLTARQVVDRIQKNLGAVWKDSELDVFCAGNPDMTVSGIATSFAPSLEVLRKVAKAGKNMIICPVNIPFIATAS